MTTETPGGSYEDNYPPMPGAENWQSDTNFDLGWISSLQWVANKTLINMYGDYDEFNLDPDDPLNFDDLDAEVFIDSSIGPIIYLAIWLAILVFFVIVGICWCAANKCCCCCKSSFKGRKGRNIDELENTDPNFHLRPYYSERNNKSSGTISTASIVLSLFMAVWLVGFLIMILYAFASNEKTKDAIDQIQPDLENAIDDIDKYIDVTRNQLNYSFVECYDTLDKKLDGIVDLCTGTGCSNEVRNRLKAELEQALTRTRNGDILGPLNELDKALLQVKDDMRAAKDDLDEQFEDRISESKLGAYWAFMLLNVLYCIIFGLVLIGTVLAAFGIGSGIKTSGFLLMRASIVITFIVAIFVVLQMAAMFVISGVTAGIICPAVRELEEEREPTTPITDSTMMGLKQDGDNWEIPNVGEILRACKRDESAYKAFNLQNVYNVDEITKIVENFDLPISAWSNSKGVGAKADLTPKETVEMIKDEVRTYAFFVRDSVKDRVGMCEPVYNAVNATVSLFCDKITAPIASYWFILQFIPLVFILIFITALFFERLL